MEIALRKAGLIDDFGNLVDDSDEVHSAQDPDSVSNRSLLANALESVAQNDIERNKLAQYKEKIALIEAEQAALGSNLSLQNKKDTNWCPFAWRRWKTENYVHKSYSQSFVTIRKRAVPFSFNVNSIRFVDCCGISAPKTGVTL